MEGLYHINIINIEERLIAKFQFFIFFVPDTMYNSGHHHHHHKQGAPVSPDSAAAADVFEQLCTASTFKSVLYHYRLLCDVLRLKPTNFRNFYPKLKVIIMIFVSFCVCKCLYLLVQIDGYRYI